MHRRGACGPGASTRAEVRVPGGALTLIAGWATLQVLPEGSSHIGLAESRVRRFLLPPSALVALCAPQCRSCLPIAHTQRCSGAAASAAVAGQAKGRSAERMLLCGL